MRVRTCLATVLACLAMSPSAFCEPGKWTPAQMLEFDPAHLKKLGLELAPEELWNSEGGGLLEAAVQINGCSAAFVSADGLMLTNHHCVFSILQQHATTENDLIARGFLASRRDEELPGKSVRATLPVKFVDVTAEVEAAAAGAADDFERFQRLELKKKQLVAGCEAKPNRRCQVATFDDGVSYQLVESVEFPDVRLVYAPPRAVGEYGGEIDNWSWPRHTGDFALVRVYGAHGKAPAPFAATNLPYQPRRYFPLSTRGLAEGDFVMVLGYPGLTWRSSIAVEMSERYERQFPRRAELYQDWIGLMEAAGASDEAARIALADRAKTLANREKSSRGQIDGIRRGRLVDKKQQADAAVLAWAASRPEQASAVAAYRALEGLMGERLATWERDFQLSQIRAGSKPLALAITLTRLALERSKPDLEREPEYQERNWNRLRDESERDQKRLHLATERRLMIDQLGRLAALPEGQRLAAVEPLFSAGRNAETVAATVDRLLSSTRLLDGAERGLIFDESVEAQRARRDPLLEFAYAVNEEIIRLERRDKEIRGAITRWRPLWRRAVAAHQGTPLDADANGTLRVSFAHVRGYEPRDGVWMKPFTTLSGVVAKHTGEEPFDAPAELLAKASQARESRWADPRLGDVPACFLATGDTTGGNSGSPVVNGRGELVGVNFDRVWENVANDFGYNPEVARNISADVRYLLWMLETLGGEPARWLLTELGVTPAQ